MAVWVAEAISSGNAMMSKTWMQPLIWLGMAMWLVGPRRPTSRYEGPRRPTSRLPSLPESSE